MWLAIMLVCANPSAVSCQVLAKTDEVFQTKQECETEVKSAAQEFQLRGVLAVPSCFKVGESA